MSDYVTRFKAWVERAPRCAVVLPLVSTSGLRVRLDRSNVSDATLDQAMTELAAIRRWRSEMPENGALETRSKFIDDAIAALGSPDVEVRDAAISTLEKLGGRDAHSALAKYTDPTEPWLTDYARRVSRDIAP